MNDVEKLVKSQPDPKVFFKIFLELGVKSMIPYLSFSMKSIEEILHEKNKKYFNPQFPLFFMNEDGNNSIDIALENNQLRSVSLMIDYIVKN